ncbi:toprim domain-containing protein [Spirillospora sp. CA-294931]|uniref:toprim domain-containing protein n=1 Tax=Spirillospora sp. CA-294931 TaxID=3240042 RepID=UPI003D919ABF
MGILSSRALDPHEQRRQMDVLRALTEQETARLYRGERSWTWWLDRAARHGRYGFANTLLISAQRPEATDVRSYNDWKSVERQVRKGETGIRIISRGGTPRSVFDVSQTEGPELAAPRSATPAEAWQAIRHLAIEIGLHIDRGERWTYMGAPERLVRIDPSLTDLEAAQNLAHQLGHTARRGDRPDSSGTITHACHGGRRLEADSIAYLLLANLGVQAPALNSSPIAAWAGSDPRARPLAAIQMAGDRILRATSQLRRRLSEPTLPSDEAAKPTPLETPATLEGTQSTPPRTELVDVHVTAHAFYQQQMADSWVPEYLNERGFEASVQREWGIGYAPKAWRTLTEHLRGLGYSDHTISAAGLARIDQGGRLYDLFRDRAVFPIRDADGAIVAFIGRRLDGAKGPKYINTPDSALFHKGELLYGLSETSDQLAAGARPVIVEGPLDAIAINTAARERYAAVAICGTALNAAQITKLGERSDLNTVGVLIALDGDGAGRGATVRTWDALGQVRGPLGRVTFSEGQDPADILSYQGCVSLYAALQHESPLADFVVDSAIDRFVGRLTTAESRLTAARAAAKALAAGRPTEIARQVARIAEMLDLPTAVVTEALTSAVSPDPLTATRSTADEFPLPALMERAPPLDTDAFAGPDLPRRSHRSPSR